VCICTYLSITQDGATITDYITKIATYVYIRNVLYVYIYAHTYTITQNGTTIIDYFSKIATYVYVRNVLYVYTYSHIYTITQDGATVSQDKQGALKDS